MTDQDRDVGLPGTPGWLELRGLRVHKDIEAVAPIEPYIRGLVQSGGLESGVHFQPKSPVIGDVPEVPQEGTTPGWLTFQPIQFHPMMESIGKIPPYIDGAMDEQGCFYPSGPLEVADGPIS
jgi:hypothetical protein